MSSSVRDGARSWRWATLAIVATLCALFAAQARAVGLDESFGKNGSAMIGMSFAGSAQYSWPAGWDNARVKTIGGPGGSTLLASAHEVVRVLGNGKVDSSFGEKGRLHLGSLEGLTFKLADVAFDRQGRLLVFGSGEEATVTRALAFTHDEVAGVHVHPSYAVVARYTPSGALDTTFGGGGGIARSNFNTHAGAPVVVGGEAPPLVTVLAGSVDSQGRPVVVASSGSLGASKYGQSVVQSAPFVARLTASGDFESGFAAGNGIVYLASDQQEIEVAVSQSESILVTGTTFSGANQGLPVEQAMTAITALNSDGTLNATYGTNGNQVVLGGAAVALDSKNRLLVLQRERDSGKQQILRLLANGQLDPKFGHGGRVGLQRPKGAAVSSMVVDAKGRALLVGLGDVVSPSTSEPDGTWFARQLVVGRLLASGARDQHFGDGGWLRTRFGKGTKLAGSLSLGAAISAEGQLLVADGAASPQRPAGGMLLAGYELGK